MRFLLCFFVMNLYSAEDSSSRALASVVLVYEKYYYPSTDFFADEKTELRVGDLPTSQQDPLFEDLLFLFQKSQEKMAVAAIAQAPLVTEVKSRKRKYGKTLEEKVEYRNKRRKRDAVHKRVKRFREHLKKCQDQYPALYKKFSHTIPWGKVHQYTIQNDIAVAVANYWTDKKKECTKKLPEIEKLAVEKKLSLDTIKEIIT